METITVGTCSLCGGAVQTPRYWASVEPAPKTCSQCGATAANHGPVIDMAQRRQQVTTETMFIGPGLVPYKAEGMTQLDPEAAQILADNLWDMYQES